MYSEQSDVNRVRELLSERSRKRRYIRGDIVVDVLSNATGFDRQRVLKCLKELKGAGEIACENWYRGEPMGRLQLNLKISRTAAHLSWLCALEKEGLKTLDIESLEPLYPYVDDWEEDDLSSLVQGLIALRDDMHMLRGHSRYTVSARYLNGSSKILDALPNAVLRSFGVDPSALAKAPSYLMTAGPPDPTAVLLIENPQAFELAVSSAIIDTVALVATFGYGLSRAGDDFGRQLASHIESNDPLIALVRKGSPPTLEILLSHPKAYFWGDLDSEGLKIFWRLKSQLPQLLLSATYFPMIQSLESGKFHPYSNISGKANQQKWHCNDEIVEHLLTLCTNKAVDQELIDTSALERYATEPLDWKYLSPLLTHTSI